MRTFSSGLQKTTLSQSVYAGHAFSVARLAPIPPRCRSHFHVISRTHYAASGAEKSAIGDMFPSKSGWGAASRESAGGRDYGATRGGRPGDRGKFGGDRYGDAGIARRASGDGEYSSRPPTRTTGDLQGLLGALGASLKPPDWSQSTSLKVDAVYHPHPEVASMTPDQVKKWRNEQGFVIDGECPNPILKFDHAPFIQSTIATLKSRYDAPSPIQAQGWPVAASGYDMVGRAQTGSGKTLAFLLPLMEHIKSQPPIRRTQGDGPVALVLAPTRELAIQIYEEAMNFRKLYNIEVAVVHGGSGNRMTQLRHLSRSPSLVVATPGRFIDFIEEGVTNCKRTSFVVLDEADRMLDMGFEDQVRAILDQVRPDRQLLMFSATWPKQVAALAKNYLTNPTIITSGSTELAANPNVKQIIVTCPPFARTGLLDKILEESDGNKILIFAGSKANCDFLGEHLYKNFKDLNFAVLHGDKSQMQRQNILEDFRSNYLSILVATDVASRGLDVKDIDLVINYELPQNIEDYIHRIGRTARGGSSGTSISFLTPAYHRLVPELIDCMKEAKQEIPDDLMRLSQELKSSSRGGGRSGGRASSGGRGGGAGSNKNRYGDRWGSRSRDFDDE